MQSFQFLLIDDNAEARFLLSKTLLRKFPKSMTRECEDAEVAVAAVGKMDIDLVVVHRLWDTDGATLIRRIRAVNPTVPIVAVSGIDRSKEALAAGATRFLNYDEWLRIGGLAAELLGEAIDSAAPFVRILPAGGVSPEGVTRISMQNSPDWP